MGFAIVFTTLAVKSKASAERKFLNNLTASVNAIILGLTGNINDRLSAERIRAMIENGKPLPLLVNGVPGLELKSIPEQQPLRAREPVIRRVENVVWTTSIVITITPPDYGIPSFDRLLAAAANAGEDRGAGNGTGTR